MAIAKLRSVVLDCPDTMALAQFYRELLGWEFSYTESVEEGGWIMLSDGGYVHLAFQLAPDYRPPSWPDPESPQQFHLDLMVDDLDVAERQALELGATLVETQPSPEDFRVFRDPAGHLFCLCVR
jgi:predicted enzyme related to lactoylglutathione lyase